MLTEILPRLTLCPPQTLGTWVKTVGTISTDTANQIVQHFCQQMASNMTHQSLEQSTCFHMICTCGH
jgi:hypothetical protein